MRKSFTRLFSVFALICVFGFQALAGWDGDTSVPMDANPNVNPADIATQFVVAFDDAPVLSAAGGTMVVYEDGAIIATIPVNSSSADVQVVEKTIVVTHGIATIKEETDYEIRLTGTTVVDEPAIDDGDWTFTTGDFTAPKLIAEAPLTPVGASVEATILENEFNLVLKFDEPVLLGEGNIAIYQANGTVVELIDVADLVHLGGSTLTVPVSDDARFIPETVYYVRVAPNAITDDVSDYDGEEDATPNAYAGIEDNTTWTFTTRDNTAPEITLSVSDVTGTTAKLHVTISEDGGFYWMVQEETEAAPSDISEFSALVEADAATEKVIDVTVGAGGVKYEVYVVAENDLDPKNITELPGKKVEFTTVDNTGPVALDRGTVEEAKKTTGVYIIFDEEVVGGEGLLELREQGTNALVIPEMAATGLTSTKITADGPYKNKYKVVIDFGVELESEKEYYVVFPKGFLVDQTGNLYGDDIPGIAVPLAATDWEFEGYDFEAPVVKFWTTTKTTETTSNISAAGNDDVIYVQFDEAVLLVDGEAWGDVDTFQEWTKYIAFKKDGVTVPAGFAYDAGNTRIAVTPGAAMVSNSVYTVVLQAGVVEDANENVVADLQTITVTTDDNDTPAYVYGPAGALEATTPLTITFNKDVFLVDGDDTNPLVSADLADLLTLTVDGDAAEFTAEYDAATMTITVTATEDFPTSVCDDPAVAVTLAFDDSDVEDSQEADFGGTADYDWTVADYTAPVAELLSGDVEISDITDDATIRFDEAATILGDYDGGALAGSKTIFKLKADDVNGANLPFTVNVVPTGVDLVPDGWAWTVGKTYYYGVGSSMEDCANNVIAATYKTFTVIADPVDPTVEAVTYTVNGGSAIAIDETAMDVEADATTGDVVVKVTFNMNVDDKFVPTDVVTTTFSDGAPILVTATDAHIDGAVLTITIEDPIIPDPITEYTITIPAGLVEGNATFNGTDFAQLEDPVVITVKTADNEAPTITDVDPGDTDTDVAVDFETMTITFSEDVQLGSGKITFTDAAGEEQSITVSSSNVSIEDNVAEVDVAMLDDYNTAYDVLIEKAVFEDKAGNTLAANEELTFTTEVNPQPMIKDLGEGEIVVTPADNSDQVTSGSEIDLTIQFTEEVEQAGDIGTRKLVYVLEHTGAGSRAAFDAELDLVENDDNVVYFAYVELDKVSISGSLVTVSGVELAASKNYYVMITPGAFIDKSTGESALGAPVPGEYAGIEDHTTWNFTTSNVNAPDVELSFSALGEDELPLKGSDIIITFSKPIVKAGEGDVAITNVEIPELITLTKNPGTLDEVEIEYTGTISADKMTITIDNSSLVILGEMDGSTEYEVAFEAGTFKVENASINLDGWDDTFMTSDYDAPDAPTFAFKGDNEATAISIVDGVHTAEFVFTDESEGDGVMFYYYWTADLETEFAAQQVMDLGVEVKAADMDKALKFNADMVSETKYRIVAIAVDAAGNDSEVTDFMYWTDDNVKPMIDGDLPTELGENDNLVLLFDEDVAPAGTMKARVIDANGVTYLADIEAVTEGDDKALQINIDALALPISDDVASYTVEIDGGMIMDVPRETTADGAANVANYFDGILGMSFSIVSDDEVAPELVSAEPDEEYVDLNVTFTLTFSEAVKLNDTFTQFVLYEEAAGPTLLKAAVIGAPDGTAYDIINADDVTIDGNVVTLTVTRALVSEKYYYLRIIDGTFSDMANNPWDNGEDVILEIEGKDLNVPMAEFAAGATDLPSEDALSTIPTTLTIDFDEDVRINAEDAAVNTFDLQAHISLKEGETAVPFMASYEDEVITVTVDADDLEKGSTYTLAYINIYDEDGNMQAGESVDFTIAEDAVAEPADLVFTPGDNDDDSDTKVGITTDQTFKVEFNGTIYSYSTVEIENNLIVNAAWLATNNVFAITPMPADAELAVVYEVVDGKSVVTLSIDKAFDSETTYTLTVDGSKIQVGQGNATSMADFTETYTTADVDAPYLVMVDDEVSVEAYIPELGMIAVKDGVLGLVFNEEVVGAGSIEIHRWDGTLVATVDVTGIEGEDEAPFEIELVDIAAAMAANAQFVSNENYYVIVPAGAVTDVAGNPFAGITGINDWAFELQDDNMPVVTLAINGMDNIAVDTDIDLTFDRDVELNPGEMGWLAIYEEMDGDAVQLIRINNDVDAIDAATSYSFDIDELMPDTKYYVELGEGSFVLAADGVTGQAQVTIGEWWFTTETNEELVAETYVPAHEETSTFAVLPSADLVITFNQEVIAGTGNIQLHNKLAVGDDIITSFDVTNPAEVIFEGMTLTIPAAVLGLTENSEYYVIVPETAVSNKSVTPEFWAGVTTPLAWSFSTVTDGTAPTATYSPNGETIADNHPTFVMTFDEAVVYGVEGNLVVTESGADAAIMTIALTADMIAADGMSATVTYEYNAETGGLNKDTEYVVTVDAGVFTDATGNPFAGVAAGEWSFTTGADFATDVEPGDQVAEGFKVYPNPFNDYVKVDNASQLDRIVISNVAGQRVKDIVSPDAEIKTGDMRSGIYFITLVKDGAAVKTERIVKR